MSATVKIAVISDLHCRVSGNGENSVTRLLSDLPKKPEIKHPVVALLRLIKQQSLTVDCVLCPGDITDKADRQGLTSGWGFLKEIQTAFNAASLIATVGNHDVKSRDEVEPAFEFLKTFDDIYPLGDETLNDEYWSKHFSIVECNNLSVLVYDSCHSHTDKEKAKHCNITPATLEAIEERIKLIGSNVIKVAMCHHHPKKHANKDYVDADVMDKGDAFIELLAKYGYSILIHGHKHEPRLFVFDLLPVLASGSFSSRENLLDSASENVFHLVTLESHPNRGYVETYVYNPNKGWLINRGESFPSFTGFGNQKTVDTLVVECSAWFLSKGDQYITFREVLEYFPDINYLPPMQQREFQNRLKDQFKIEFIPCLEDGSSMMWKML